MRNSQWDFLLRKQISGSSVIFLISVLPLYKKYPIVNRYLTPQINPLIFEKFNVRILDPLATDGLKINFEEQTLFVIDIIDSNGKDMISLSLALLALISFILSVIHFLRRLHNQRKVSNCVSLGSKIFILLCLVMLQLSFPGSWHETKIFSPQAFASSV
ncbi:MAG: hypothetical protein U5K54_03555 [Cytophagales bacterium]|nr:hypothetical protein [Cytophagales bacterium]